MKTSTFNRAVHQSTRPKYLRNGGANRFEYFLSHLTRNFSCIDENGFGVALLAFDGVTYDNILQAVKQIPYATDEGVCISWRSKDGRYHRTLLSAMSIKIYTEQLYKAKTGFNEKKFEQFYAKFAGYKDTIQAFKEDQMQWLALNFSGPLFEHISGRMLFSGVPDSAYRRQKTKRRLIVESQTDSASDKAISETISGYLEPIGLDKNPVIIDHLIHACRRRVKIANHLAKNYMLDECLLLSNPAKEHGPLTSIIVAWAISLIVHGSRNQENLSQAAVANYVTVVALKLFSHFRDKEIQSFHSQDFEELYKRVIDSVTVGQQKIAASAISAFHNFLEDWLDAPFISRQKYHQDSDTIPRANVIWQHEVDQILDWLNLADCDERLVQIWRLAILIGYEKRIRIGELLAIHLQDIQFFEDQVQVFIAGQKSKAAKRYIVIKSPQTIQLLKVFVERRRKEFALGKELLLGDPKQPQSVYKLGQFYYGLNSLLKAVTGEHQASYHWLSHSVISFGLVDILQGGISDYINPFSQFATDSGHFSIVTTFHEYMHLQHIPIRNSLDRALSKIPVTSEIVSNWTSGKAATIRKRVNQYALDQQSYYWQKMLEKTNVIEEIGSMGAEIATEKPIPPDFLAENKINGFETIFYVLRDLSNCFPEESIVSRHGLTNEEFEFIIGKTKAAICKHQLMGGWTYQITIWEAINKLSDLKKNGYDFDNAMQSKYAPIFRYLKKQKCLVSDEIQDGLFGWCDLHFESYGSYQKLDAGVGTLNFLRYLFLSGVDITKLAVFYESESVKQMSSTWEIIRQSLISSFGITPPFFSIEPRRGRPDCYFVLTNSRIDSRKPPYGSATSMAGFQAIHLAAIIWEECCHEND